MEEYKSPEEYNFNEAGSFDELYELIRKTGVVHGSVTDYQAEDLIEIIENVRKNEPGFDLDEITRTGDLRQTVIKLMHS